MGRAEHYPASDSRARGGGSRRIIAPPRSGPPSAYPASGLSASGRLWSPLRLARLRERGKRAKSLEATDGDGHVGSRISRNQPLTATQTSSSSVRTSIAPLRLRATGQNW